MKRTVLSVDWDFFFPIPENDPHYLYDWGHSEGMAVYFTHIWVVRASDFLRWQKELPGTSGEEMTFWERFTFSDQAKLYYAESHSFMMHRKIATDVTNVLNFDAHHDSGYGKGEPFHLADTKTACDNWAAFLSLYGVKVKTIYPFWKYYAFDQEHEPQVETERVLDNGAPVNDIIDDVFLCRSGAWVPGWLDDKFDEFLDRCPLQSKIQIGNLVERTWNQQDALDMQKQIEEVMKLDREKKVALQVQVEKVKQEFSG